MEIEQQMRDASAAEEPGSLKVNQNIESSTKLAPGVIQLKSAGYVWIYDTVTGEPSKVNRNMLATKLKQVRPDGSFVFDVIQRVKPFRGTFKCMLHPDSPERAHYDALGLPTCFKSNLTAPFQVERHMQKRHKQEWATINSEVEKREKEIDRALQRRILDNLGGKTEPVKETSTVAASNATDVTEPPLYVAEHPYKSRRKKGNHKK